MDHNKSDFEKKKLLQHGKSEHKLCDMLLDELQSNSWIAKFFYIYKKKNVELDTTIYNIVIVIFTYMLVHESVLSTMY